jgi:hypothetical protein
MQCTARPLCGCLSAGAVADAASPAALKASVAFSAAPTSTSASLLASERDGADVGVDPVAVAAGGSVLGTVGVENSYDDRTLRGVRVVAGSCLQCDGVVTCVLYLAVRSVGLLRPRRVQSWC